jgi:hypothetical protein
VAPATRVAFATTAIALALPAGSRPLRSASSGSEVCSADVRNGPAAGSAAHPFRSSPLPLPLSLPFLLLPFPLNSPSPSSKLLPFPLPLPLESPSFPLKPLPLPLPFSPLPLRPPPLGLMTAVRRPAGQSGVPVPAAALAGTSWYTILPKELGEVHDALTARRFLLFLRIPVY